MFVVTTLVLSLRAPSSPVLVLGAMASVAFVLAWQILAERENAALYRKLEHDRAEQAAWLQAESDLGEVLLVLDGWRVVRVNAAAEHMSRYPAEQLMAMPSIMELIAEDEREPLQRWLAQRAAGEEVAAQCESAIVRADGVRVEIEFAFIELARASDTSTMIVARDITERRRAQAEIARSEARFRSLVQAAGSVIITVDTDGRVVEFNPEAERVSRLTRDEVIGRDFTEILMPATPPEEAAAAFRRVLDGKVWRGIEIPNRREDGYGMPNVLWNITRYVDARGNPQGVIAVGQDIAQRKRSEEELWAALDELAASKVELESQSDLLEFTLAEERENARRDSLTNTLNHRAITQVIEERVQEGLTNPHQCAVVMVDIDGMKAVNDTFGHLAGDAALMHVSGTLFRAGAIVGRYGGDEFVVVLPGASRETAERYRHAVLDALAVAELTDPVSGSNIPLQASVGIAIYPEEAESVADLIRLADGAMYAEKRERSSGGDERRRSLGDDRAARMVGEIVPLLTSPGDLEDKMRLVSHRLSVGAGYDGVSFTLFAPTPGRPLAVTASMPFDSTLEQAWLRVQSEDGGGLSPMRAALEEGRQPLIIDDVATHPAISPAQREPLTVAGIRSALVVPMIWEGQLVGALSVGSRRGAAFDARDAQFVLAVATQVTAIVRTHRLVGDLEAATARLAGAQAETVMMLAAAAEAHDRTTGLHLVSIRTLAEQLARELGYSTADVDALGLAAVLHDIGKISVPDAVLSSSGRLEGDEWSLMKRHTVWGAEFLSGRPEFRLARQVARSHHERWDGAGYPDGLAGDQIPEAAQIVTVADSFDAMTHDRPYKKGRSVREAVAEILSCSGKQFSPRIVAALVRLFDSGALTDEEHFAEAA